MKRAIISVMAVLVCGVVAHAGTRADLSGDGVVDFQTTMDLPLMRVGDVGNAPYTNAHGTHGSVSYEYLMGKFEVTFAKWLAVKQWAEAKGYTFSRQGHLGSGEHVFAV